MAAPGDFAPGERAHGAHAAAARRAARTRTGPRAAIRLSGQPYPVGDRDPAVLPPGGMVGVAAGARRARALLRRSRRRRVRGPTLLREGAAGYGAAPRHAAGLRSGGGGARWLAHGPHPAARGAGADGDLSPLDGWRDRRGPRTRRRRPRGAGDGGPGPERRRRHANGDARFLDPPRRGAAQPGRAPRGGEDPRAGPRPAEGAAAAGPRPTRPRRGGAG